MDFTLKMSTDVPEELNRRLQQLVRGTNYTIVQNNGQRIYSMPKQSGFTPPKGAEIFVGNLPTDMYEDELVPIFRMIGPIHSIRLMLDFFGRNRGYAFISYFVQEHAALAISQLNNYKVRNRTKLAVCISVDNRRLFIGNIPKSIARLELQFLLERYVEGVLEVIMYQELENKEANRGFVFVEFESHRHAAIARRQLSPGNLTIWGQPIFVDWADPLPYVNPDILKQVTKLYLSNIPVEYSTDQMKIIMDEILGDTAMHMLKVHKMRDYAFIHFTVRIYAEEALSKLMGLIIKNNLIKVEWARPIEYSKKHRASKVPNNFCRSVPPAIRKLVVQSVSKKNSPRTYSGDTNNNSLWSSSGSDGEGSCHICNETMFCSYNKIQ